MFDILQSLKTVAEDRMKSPVFGTALFVLGIHQWRVVAILLTSYKYEHPSDLLVALDASWISMGWGEWGCFCLYCAGALLVFPVLGLLVDLAKSGIDLTYKLAHENIMKYERYTVKETQVIKANLVKRENESLALVERTEKDLNEIREKYVDKCKESDNLRERLEDQIGSLQAGIDRIQEEKSVLAKEKENVSSIGVRLVDEIVGLYRLFLGGLNKGPDELMSISDNEVRGIAKRFFVIFSESNEYGAGILEKDGLQGLYDQLVKIMDSPRVDVVRGDNPSYKKAREIQSKIQEEPNRLHDFKVMAKNAKYRVVSREGYVSEDSIDYLIGMGVIERYGVVGGKERNHLLVTQLGDDLFKVLNRTR